MPNRLQHETSPYLLQHKDNPVDWYPWSPEALERARREDKPVFLSIGYSACHWCHVMEHESFEDEETAALMNQHFISVKVDREERPDLDDIHMTAVQAMTGQGGWPLNVFLTPAGKPFFGGTYFPKDERHGLPSFKRVLEAVADAFRSKRDDIERVSEQIVGRLQEQEVVSGQRVALEPGLLTQAERQIANSFDATHGGFGGAPKFPQPMILEFLLRFHRRSGSTPALRMVERTLDKMARGGIYDQIGGGFHRYSTDAFWLVPHFEKMLYDNAQLAQAYLHAYQVTKKPLYRRIVEETLDYAIREMLSSEGGFFSAQDADSEGVEGKFYVWTVDEIRETLDPEEARIVELHFDVSGEGNWEGENILNVRRDDDVVAHLAGISIEQLQQTIQRSREKLYAARSKRVPPGMDDKVLAAWNGLMLQAMSEAAIVLDRGDYREVARRNGEFMITRLKRGDRLCRTFKGGRAKIDAFLEDYAFVINGLLALYEATFDLQWIREARSLAGYALQHLRAPDGAGFFDTSDASERLAYRPRAIVDSAIPSGNSGMAMALQRLATLTGDDILAEPAIGYLRSMAGAAVQHPTAFGQLLSAIDTQISTPTEVAIVGESGADETKALLKAAFEDYLPNRVVAFKPEPGASEHETLPLLAQRSMVDGHAAAYVCEHFSCLKPVTSPEELKAQLMAPS